MSLTHQLITINGTQPSILTIPENQEKDYPQDITISVQNLDNQKYVYLGDSEVSQSSYGYRLDPGQTWTADLKPRDDVYAVCSDTSMQVAVIRVNH